MLSVVDRLQLVGAYSLASLRASIRSLLLPSFNRAAFRGSQTTNWLTWGFKVMQPGSGCSFLEGQRQSSLQSLDELNDRGCFGLQQAFHDQLALSIHHGNRNGGLMNVHADILFLTYTIR